MSKSAKLSVRQLQRDKLLIEDSCQSELILSKSICEIIKYANSIFNQRGYNIVVEPKLSIFQCQLYFEKIGGPKPNPENKKYYMKPDGGILFAVSGDERIPILICEDKVQGTNDNRYAQNMKKQATGNAIERAGKNMRGAEMLFSQLTIFPYVIFASGCDFHATETIAKRLEMMNMGIPNHYIEISPTTDNPNIDSIIPSIDIKKICDKSVASIFVKAHKWDEMKHGSSLWKKDEQVAILKKIIDDVFDNLFAGN